MAQIRRKALQLLDRLYNFEGGLRSSDQVDIEAPITLVHDVSREAELATITGVGPALGPPDYPYFIISEPHVHAGAGLIATERGLYSNQPDAVLATFDPIDPVTETVWILSAFAVASAAVVVEALIGTVDFAQVMRASSGQTAINLLYSGAGTGAPWAGGERPVVNFTTLDTPNLPALPIPMNDKQPATAVLQYATNASGAGTIDLFLNCIRLPNGVMPPGHR